MRNAQNPLVLSPLSASVSTAESSVAPAASVAKSIAEKDVWDVLSDLNVEVRQLAKSLDAANEHIAALLKRLAVAESNLATLQCTPKPVWLTPITGPYFPYRPYVDMETPPYWRPNTVWCHGQEQGKLSG